MKITEETKYKPHDADQSDFNFLHEVIRELELIPTKEKVTFPLPNRSSAFADIECLMGYDRSYRPYGEFAFTLRKHDMEMAHTAVVSTTVMNGKLELHLCIRPNAKLRKAGHKSMIKVLPDAKAIAQAMCRNFFVGSVGRKIVIIPPQKEAA